MNERTNAFAHTQGHVNRHTHQIHQNPAMREREGKRQREGETNRKTQRVDKRQTDKHPYLFVHFNVEAIRHLIVLRGTESEMVRLVNSQPLK